MQNDTIECQRVSTNMYIVADNMQSITGIALLVYLYIYRNTTKLVIFRFSFFFFLNKTQTKPHFKRKSLSLRNINGLTGFYNL